MSTVSPSRAGLSCPARASERITCLDCRLVRALFFGRARCGLDPRPRDFRDLAEGTEAIGGLSSPKRYLCDTRAVTQEWRFPDRDYGHDNTPPLIDRALRQFVNAKGDVIEQLEQDRKRYGFTIRSEDRLGATRMTFSRSSFFTFLVAEVLCHALSESNSVGVRQRTPHEDAPRRLRRLILLCRLPCPCRSNAFCVHEPKAP